MTKTLNVLLAVGVLSALSSPVLAGPCSDRIADIERSISMGAAGTGPTATGTVQANASGATTGNNPAPSAADASSRLPANRPATPDSAAAQTQSNAADQSAANAPAEPNRLPAQRPPSPDAKAAAVEAGRPAPAMSQQDSTVRGLLSEARNLDQAGREADCMESVSRIDQIK